VSLRTFAGLLLLFAAACCGKQPRPAPETASSATASVAQVPHVTLVAVTDWQGVLKPCGCTPDLQKGGIERIARYVGDLRANDDSVLVVHAGSLLAERDTVSTPAHRAQWQLRLQAFAQALGRLGVAAVARSGFDLEVGGEDAQAAYDKLAATVLGAGARPTLLQRTASGVQVGFAALDTPADEAGLAANVAGLRQQGAQVVVVLDNLGLRSARKAARAVPGIDAIVVGKLDEKVEPEMDLDREGDTLLVQATRHGAWVSVLTLAPRGRSQGAWVDASAWLPGAASELQAREQALGKQVEQLRVKGTEAARKSLPFHEAERAELAKRRTAAQAAAGKPLPEGRLAAWRTVGLDWSAPVDPEVQAIVQRYDGEVATLNEKLAGEIPPVPAGQAGYVGQQVCLGCHSAVQGYVAQDLHQHAWSVLEAAGKAKDLDCVPCHVTGFGKPGGSIFGKPAHLRMVQCEACHGPGSLHVAAPQPSNIRKAVDAQTCGGCHTAEHSPRFVFADYRARLLVPGHGAPMAKPQ
jgi:hypothetical protein